MKLWMFWPASEHLRMGGSINGALGAGADEETAREAVIAAKPNGSFDESRFLDWSSLLIADGDVGLPFGAAAQFFGTTYSPAMPNPGA